jgi:hypothetical protein
VDRSHPFTEARENPVKFLVQLVIASMGIYEEKRFVKPHDGSPTILKSFFIFPEKKVEQTVEWGICEEREETHGGA